MCFSHQQFSLILIEEMWWIKWGKDPFLVTTISHLTWTNEPSGLAHLSFRSSLGINRELLHRGHPLSTYAKFSEKLTFLIPWHAYVRVRIRELEMLVFQKILRTYLMDDPISFREKVGTVLKFYFNQ